jgi:cytochrome P450
MSGPNLAKFIVLVNIPGVVAAMKTDLAFNTRKWWGLFKVLKPAEILVTSMRTIKDVSAGMLKEKIAEAETVGTNAFAAKRDIMSILVRARQAEKGKADGYAMSDQAMMNQVLTFLGAGHETTATGLSWVRRVQCPYMSLRLNAVSDSMAPGQRQRSPEETS